VTEKVADEEVERKGENKSFLLNQPLTGLRYAGSRTAKSPHSQDDWTSSQPRATTSEDLPRPHIPCQPAPTRLSMAGPARHMPRSPDSGICQEEVIEEEAECPNEQEGDEITIHVTPQDIALKE
jgi:hypothetical protein